MSDEGERVEATIESFLTGGLDQCGATARPDSRRPSGRPAPPAAPTRDRPAPHSPAGRAQRAADRPARSSAAAGAGRPLPPARPRLRPAPKARLDWEVRLRDEEARLCALPSAGLGRPRRGRRDGAARPTARSGCRRADRAAGRPDADPPGPRRRPRRPDRPQPVRRPAAGDRRDPGDQLRRARSGRECDRWLAAGAVATRLAIGWACPTPGGDLRTATRIAEERLNADRRTAYHAPGRAGAESPIGSGEPAADAGPSGGIGAMELTPPDGAE